EAEPFDDVPGLVRAPEQVGFPDFPVQLTAVTLRQAAGHHDLLTFGAMVERRADFVDRLFLGRCAETAAVDDGSGAAVAGCGQGEAGATELTEDVFAVDLVFGTAEVDDTHLAVPGGDGGGRGGGAGRVLRHNGSGSGGVKGTKVTAPCPGGRPAARPGGGPLPVRQCGRGLAGRGRGGRRNRLGCGFGRRGGV